MKRTNFYFCCHDTVAEIQAGFSHYYPSLEINFFSNNEKYHPDNAWVMLSPAVRISDISPESRDGCVVLNDKMTITDLENSLQDHFKLHVEISPRIVKQNFTFSHVRVTELKTTDPGWVSYPEQEYMPYFKNVPFGC